MGLSGRIYVVLLLDESSQDLISGCTAKPVPKLLHLEKSPNYIGPLNIFSVFCFLRKQHPANFRNCHIVNFCLFACGRYFSMSRKDQIPTLFAKNGQSHPRSIYPTLNSSVPSTNSFLPPLTGRLLPLPPRHPPPPSGPP